MAKDTPKQINAEAIHKNIVNYINNEVNHIDALVQYAEDNDLEIELVAQIISKSPTLKAKVRTDAEKLKMVEPAKKMV